MELVDFVKKYNGKKVDYDGVFGAQCVDLFRQYCHDALCIPEHTGICGTSGGAKDLFLDYPKMEKEKKYFKRYFNGKKTMNIGDVLVWNSTDENIYGHVAILIGKLDDDLIVFEQNGYKQNGAQINIRNKENLLGFLRKK